MIEPVTEDSAEPSATGAFARTPSRQFSMAFGLYLLWFALAWLGHLIGEIAIHSDTVSVMLAGIAATNALFFGLSRDRSPMRPPASALATAQCIMGIAWTSVFAYLTHGGGDLAFGMYLTATVFGLFQVGQRTFVRLALFASAGYAAVLLSTALLGTAPRSTWSQGLSLAVFLGVMLWLMIFAGHLNGLRRQLQQRNTELKDGIRKLTRVAERDHLTKSFSRHYIMDTLAREKGRADRSNNPVSICIFDLDHFKAVNDQHGHLVGDRILRAFARRVRGELRTMDAVNRSDYKRSFGRFGGEEFIAVLPCTGLIGAERCAERIRLALAGRPVDGTYPVTVSVGVAEYRRGETVPELLARADEALYQAKAEGRNRVCCSGRKEKMNARVMDLRRAAPRAN
jgi:diguanylate cyclase (GGDEF)-like protein